ncbi:MAG: alpha-glucan family phosphorylase [Planctomycetes bacterium]|nr:alpha-glucan family phosphorylase [Planctomycetota bacterium]
MLSPDLARIRAFEVVPSLPEPLKPLLRIAHNLWWTWHPEAVELFSRVERNLWEATNHNPIKLLGACPQSRLDEVARDEGFLHSLERCVQNLERHLTRTPWIVKQKLSSDAPFTIAYFCAEFGLTECLQIYSGGLGCLAGDHLKSATELGMPLVGVGLLYRNGYFQQYLNADGWQQEYYPELDFSNLPISPVLGDNGKQIKVSVQLPGRDVWIAVWKAVVGRIPLYLLDTNIPENDAADRGITSQLYGGDMEMRIKQEIVLGIGGIHALSAMGIEPDVCHMNEGHSAFLALERIRRLIEKHGVTFDEARQQAAASHVFTTHTPVPAGIDRFPPDMIQRYFKNYHPMLKLDIEGLLALGRENVFAKNEFFSMAVLAIRTAEHVNGVSRLHGEVSRNMWKGIWPGVPDGEVPITHVTNGVHARSWLSGELIQLLDRYLGSRWQNDPADQTVWQQVNEVPDEELWRVHERRRHQLIIWTRQRLKAQSEARGMDTEVIRPMSEALSPNALTIGFARRFATYKRATLLMRDPARLKALLANQQQPVQFLIAGKAHPADGGGKDLIRQIVRFAGDAGHRIIFVENYDINVAKWLVQGCDVWLNTPKRGMEASGTSGMKAALNGVLNCSVRDGWWDEVGEPDLGWSIGRGESYSNTETQDDIESRTLYDLLEKQIIPLFYNRDEQGVPRHWVARMKRCISILAPAFNTNRMVQEYAQKLYLPALHRARRLSENKLAGSIELAHQKDRLRANWGKLRIEDVIADVGRPLGVGESMPVGIVINLAELAPADVRVQVFLGPMDHDGRITHGTASDMDHRQDLGGGRHRFEGTVHAPNSGRYGFAVRVVPGGELLRTVTEPGLMVWDRVPTPTPAPAPVTAAATV